MVLSSSSEAAVLHVAGSYVWFWGLEAMNSFVPPSGEYGGDNFNTSGGHNVKFINCVSHNAMVNGFGDYTDAARTEIYGCISFLNGRKTANDSYGYGVYAQNGSAGHKVYRDNFFVNNLGDWGMHIYTENGKIDSFRIAHNVVANVFGRAGLIVGGTQSGGAKDCWVDSNYSYGNPNENSSSNTGIHFGWMTGTVNARVRGNFFMQEAVDINKSTGIVFTGNRIWGPLTVNGSLVAASSLGDNLQVVDAQNRQAGPPPPASWDTVIVRRNVYDPRRIHLIVYNFSQKASVNVDLTGQVTPGTTYEVRDVQNYYGGSGGTVWPLHEPIMARWWN